MKWILPLCALLFGLVVGVVIPRGEALDAVDVGAFDDATDLADVAGEELEDDAGTIGFDLTTGERAQLERQGLGPDFLASLEGKTQFEQMGILHAKISEAQPEDYATLMDAVRKQTSSMRWMTQQMLMTRWMEESPKEVLAYMDGLPEQEQWGMRSTYYTTLAKKDPEAAYASAVQIENRRFRQSAVQSVIHAISSEDPHRAVAMALDYTDGSQNRTWLFENLFRNWGHRDATAARQAALGLPEGQLRTRALAGAMTHWMQDDPESALDWLNAQPASAMTYEVRKRALQQFLDRKPEAAKQYIEGETDPLLRREILEGIHFQNYGWERDFAQTEAMFDWLGTVATGEIYDRKVGDVVRAMTQMDRQLAMDFVTQMKPGSARMNALGAVASNLAEADPVGAIAFLNQLEYRDERERVLGSMSWSLARNHPEVARRLVEESGDELIEQRLVDPLVREWTKYDQAGALEWVGSLTDDSARQRGYSTILGNWMQRDPQGAFAYLNSGIEGKQSNYYRNAFNYWARQDPGEAVQWLGEVPEEGADRKNVYRTVADAYVRHDPMAASEWIATLDEGPDRDGAVQSMVYQLRRSDPEAAFIWSATVSDTRERGNLLRSSLNEWKASDPEAALAAVEELELDAEAKRPLLEMFK